MEDQRRQAAEKEAAARRATDAQVLEDAERLIGAWNERQAKRMPMLFSPTIGAAIAARYWFLWVRCPACRTINAIDLRTLDRHRDAAGKRSDIVFGKSNRCVSAGPEIIFEPTRLCDFLQLPQSGRVRSRNDITSTDIKPASARCKALAKNRRPGCFPSARLP